MTVGIPSPRVGMAWVQSNGSLTREAWALLDALRSAVGGNAATVTPVSPLGALVPVAVDHGNLLDLSPVALSQDANDMAPVAITCCATDLAPVAMPAEPGSGGVSPPFAISDVTGLQTALDAKQPITLADPTFWRALAANATGVNGNSAQPWFPSLGAVTLPVGVYAFEGQLLLNSGTTSHNVGVSFGGTATRTGAFQSRGVKSALGTASTAESTNADTGALSTNRVTTAANTTGPAQIYVRGFVRVTVEGTFIPQFTYSASPGSSSILAETRFGLWKWSDLSAATSKGTWA